jgi:hypothetical protein
MRRRTATRALLDDGGSILSLVALLNQGRLSFWNLDRVLLRVILVCWQVGVSIRPPTRARAQQHHGYRIPGQKSARGVLAEAQGPLSQKWYF